MNTAHRASLLAPILCLLASASLAAQPLRPDGGRMLGHQDASDHVSPELDKRLAEEASANIARLAAEGRLPPRAPKVDGLVWPLGPLDGAGMRYHGISNYVDLNAAFPNQLRDYTCATRTYDTASGYNHRGIDYFTWPFPWKLLDDGAVDVRAVAPGQIVGKGDGNNDRSCSMNAPDTPNYVTVQHADGTIARYLHLKTGSVTALPIGTQVAAGDLLGKVGSSGVSTGPHLHLELRANATAGAAVIEPHTGACNAVPTAWAEQRPYRDSRLNRISTHSAPPTSPPCSGNVAVGSDVPNFKDAYMPGDPIIFLAAYRDQGKGSATQFRVIRPDQTVHQTWSFDLASQAGAPDFYNASYWYWNMSVPAGAQHGLWTFEATYNGVTERHRYRVGNTTTPLADMRGLIGAWYEPATAGQGLEFHWINDNISLVFFYGHKDNGENFFLLGQRDGAFDYGQEITYEMRLATGGRFNGLDPAAIQRPVWGTAKITFVSCSSAVVELDGIDGDQVLTLERLGRTTGLDCE